MSSGLIAELQTSGKAKTCLVLGILSFFIPVLPSLPGIIFGVLGLRDIGRSQGRLKGNGLAIAGLVLSGVGLVLSLLVCMVALVATIGYMRYQEQAKVSHSRLQMMQIEQAVEMYRFEHDNECPENLRVAYCAW